MVWKKIDSPEEVADCENSRVFFTIPYASDFIKNWEELGRTGAMTCCFRPNIRKRWTSFGMSSFNENYGLVLESDGLRRLITSAIRGEMSEGILQGVAVIELTHKKVGLGDFEDFKIMGDYAVKRFPFIANELTNGIEKKLGESIFYCTEVKKVARQLRGDWEFYQAMVSEAFYNMFCQSVLGREDLEPSQARKLVELVAPLNVKAVDKRYSNIELYNPEE